MQTTIDEAGRVVIPKAIRDGAGLRPGTPLEIVLVRGCIEILPTVAPTRIVEEAGHSQLGLSWGDAKNPQCGGFSVSQFQQIDLSNVDFSDFYDDKLAQLADNDPNSTVAAITASINSMNTSRTPEK